MILELFFYSLCHLILLWSWLFPLFYWSWALFVVVPLVLVDVGLVGSCEIFVSFLDRPVLLWTFLSGLPLLCPICFGLLGFHFYLFPETFWFLPWSHLFTHSLFNNMSFSLHDFECLWFFLWGWFIVSAPCGQRKCLIWLQFSWICWGLLCVLSCGLSLKMFHVHLKRMCILLLWGERFCIYQFSHLI